MLRSWANEKGLPVEPLPFGDFWLITNEHWVVVQRKTVSDLLQSIDDGRLEKDLGTGLTTKGVDEVVLLIEGKMNVRKDGYIYTGSRKWSLTAKTVITGIFDLYRYGVLPLYNPQDDPLTSAEILYKMWEDLSDPEFVTSLITRGLGGTRKDVWQGVSQAERSLIRLRVGFGPKTAANALGDLSLREFLSLSEEELLAIPNIGPEKARKILEVANGRVPKSHR